jgi:hypothetical protein
MSAAKFEEAQKCFSISDHDLIAYQREVESFAKAAQSPGIPRPAKATSFAGATKLSRHEYRARKKAAKEKFEEKKR